jgi:hypothetical protein
MLELPSVLNARNVPLRLALAAAGFRAPEAEPDPADGAAADAGPGGMEADRGENAPGERRVVYRRSLAQPLPEPPGWLTDPADSVPADTADALQAGQADSVQADPAEALQAAPANSPQGERRRRTGGAP